MTAPIHVGDSPFGQRPLAEVIETDHFSTKKGVMVRGTVACKELEQAHGAVTACYADGLGRQTSATHPENGTSETPAWNELGQQRFQEELLSGR